ncbi:MAG: hypothetical protein LBH25_07675 [Fibromonadaceae bacterium]|jgi:hypothetical protein|nr:hypothetical protein [Fibromonadaceae bacterium]
MLNFFKIAPLRSLLKFRKFVTVILFFAYAANAAINISTAENAEIASFIVSESNKVLRLPSDANLNLAFQTARDKHGRLVPLFFLGQREVSIAAEYVLLLSNSEQIKGTAKADTSWLTGYCGMIECRTRPMPALQRIDTLKALVQKILAELNDKFEAFPEPAANTATTPASTTAEPAADSIAGP